MSYSWGEILSRKFGKKRKTTLEEDMTVDEKTDLVAKGNKKKQNSERALTVWQKLSYGVGHVLNDLTASMWFSYLLLYLHEVVKFDNFLAGNLILIGQISDALSTPFVGFESDRTRRGFCNLGKRKSWHFVGTCCVLLSFPFIFNLCITCAHSPSYAQFIYYSPFIVIFQFGWAATQVSHLSFSSELTPHTQERVTLQSIRNFFTVFANIFVFGVFTLLFYIESVVTDDDCPNSAKITSTCNITTNTDLTPDDAPKFRNLTFISLGVGILFNVVFYIGTAGAAKEKNLGEQQHNNQSNGTIENGEALATIELSTIKHSLMSWKDWLKEHQFYQVAVLYMCTRLYINVSQVYFGIFLTETIKMDKIYIAILPLFTYSSSFVTSVITPFVNKFAGRKMAFVIGLMFGVSSSVWLYFIEVKSKQVYGAAVLLGVAGSLLLITSLSMTSDLIGDNTESGAFVFGAMSFTDKLSNGVAVFNIQKTHPSNPALYYRYIQSIVPGAALCLAFITLLTLLPQKIGVREKKKNLRHMTTPAVQTDSHNPVSDNCGQYYTPPGGNVHCTLNSGDVVTHFPEAHLGGGGICGMSDSDDNIGENESLIQGSRGRISPYSSGAHA